jgi:hypothetical protein
MDRGGFEQRVQAQHCYPTLGEIINELKTMYCKLLPFISRGEADPQATTLVYNTSTLPTENSVIGFVNESRSRLSGNTRPKKRG